MSGSYNIYCDESCHLEKDHQKAMVLGAVWCPSGSARRHYQKLREIKASHGMPAGFEVKWTKVSPAGIGLYRDWIDYFLAEPDLRFRALVVPDKSVLQHERFGQSHDDWYYKMYYQLLRVIISPNEQYRIFLDIKDTQGSEKISKLRKVLCNSLHDFSQNVIEFIQVVRSSEVELLQLTDLLTGAISYANRSLTTSQAKLSLTDRLREASGYSLTSTVPLYERKLNIFCSQAAEGASSP
jgi:hypothetical protein